MKSEGNSVCKIELFHELMKLGFSMC